MAAADFLVEIGTEELPPKALRSLMDAFAQALEQGVDDAQLKRGKVHGYASPRRLAVLIRKLGSEQPDRKLTQKGPPTKVAFDADGRPTAAAEAFAKSAASRSITWAVSRPTKANGWSATSWNAAEPRPS